MTEIDEQHEPPPHNHPGFQSLTELGGRSALTCSQDKDKQSCHSKNVAKLIINMYTNLSVLKMIALTNTCSLTLRAKGKKTLVNLH